MKAYLTQVLEYLAEDGFEQVFYDERVTYDKFIEMVRSLESHQFLMDFHVENLLVFAEKTEFHQHHLYLDGKIILQDKARSAIESNLMTRNCSLVPFIKHLTLFVLILSFVSFGNIGTAAAPRIK